MAIEVPNPWAMARLALNNPPVVTEGFGVSETLITRSSAGVYTIALVEAVDIQQAIGILQPAAGSARMTSVRIRDYASFGPQNILLETFDAAGAAVEGGNCIFMVFRFPSIPAT